MNQHDKVFEEWLVNVANSNMSATSKGNFIEDPIPWPLNKPIVDSWTQKSKLTPTTYVSGDWPRPTGTEKDPSGKALNIPGAKADSGKSRVYLCLSGFSRALEKVAEVTTVGANKYSPNGWQCVPNGYDRYMDAFGRHFLDYSKGKKLDNGPNGTGCEHMAQMIWNLLAAYELSLRTLENHGA